MKNILNEIKDIGKIAKNVVDSHLNGGIHLYGNVMHKPIGIATKSYGFVEALLHKNIGSGVFNYDGYATTIGMMANPYLYEDSESWFLIDEDKKRYDNYLSYINAIYYHGTMLPPNLNVHADGMSMDFYNTLINENSIVGAMHQYNLDNALGARLLISNGATNPNGYEDTRLGVINNFYLSSTLYNAKEKYSYKSSYTISQNAYQNFGFDGQFGINNDKLLFANGTPLSNETLFGYLTSKYEDSISGLTSYNTFARSFPLFKQSGEKTQEFIRKSLEGIDLLSDKPSTLELKEDFINQNDYLNRVSEGSGTHIINQSDVVRLIFKNVGNDTIDSAKAIYYTYAENNQFNGYDITSSVGATNSYIILGDNTLTKDDIVKYTNKQFLLGKYDTLIARFATHNGGYNENDALSSAVSEYGMSHGRNLLRKNPKEGKTNGYEDPYCRVWTFHKQYSKYSDTIRPFNSENTNILKNILKNNIQSNREKLEGYGVKTENGLVRFAPSSQDNIKRCMFSIENLAWKNIIDSTTFTKGPNEGRIMWFPPYDLKFSEQLSTNWNQTQFIGRGEKIYSYIDSERNGTLSFKLLIDHPSLLNKFTDSGNECERNVNNLEVNVSSAEQRILRFFAGCDIEIDGNDKTLQKANTNVNDEITQTATVISQGKDSTNITFSVYFPNNYSGGDDDVNDAINYLLYGIGYEYQETYKEEKYYVDNNKQKPIGGYEMDTVSGISYTLVYNDKGEPTYITPFYYQNKQNEINEWEYRVDNSKLNEVLKQGNYSDTCSFKKNYIAQSKDADLSVSFVEFASFMGDYSLSNERVKQLQKLFKSFKVEQIMATCYSSEHGYADENKTLAKKRGKTIENWLKGSNLFKNISFSHIIRDNIAIDGDSVNSERAKEARKVEIKIILNREQTTEDNKIITNADVAHENAVNNRSKTIQTKLINRITTQETERGNEYEFFTDIKNGDPILYKKVVNKIKYFNPAFHSITPEGFNARLTFLHQCTRQGNTYAASDNSQLINVRNLAFGTPPICVLRIGDFYNTKIIIKNIDIQYDDTTWDLNDEGIGVMPMMADISIGFTFIGGSDLSGPIARLQNAMSFNYYANTSIYEKQSDSKELIEDENNKSI